MARKIKRRAKKRGKGKIAKSTALAEAHKKVMKKTKPGTGARFKSLVQKLKQRGGVTNPEAVAAAIGRRKYGSKKFQQMAAKARKKKKRSKK